MRSTITPRITPLTEGFFAHARSGVLSVQRCADCHHWRFPPTHMCPECNSMSYAWEPVDGHGTLYTYTIETGLGGEEPLPGEHGHPFAIAIVELAVSTEGNRVKMVTDIDTEYLDHLWIGMPMHITFEEVTNRVTLPRFVPDAARLL